MRIAWFYGDSSQAELNTSHYRVGIPAKKLQEAGHECKIAHVSGLFTSLDNAMWADVVVIERLLVKETHDAIKKLRDAGKQVWCTFDDAYHLMPASPSRDTWRGGKNARDGKGAILNDFREGLRLCTGFMTPSKLLCEDYRMYNPRAEYVPNYLDESLWQNLPAKNPDLTVVGWGGTSLHSQGWIESGLIPALGKLCRKYPRVMVHVQPPYPDVVSMMHKMGVRYALGDWESFESWPKTVAKFHINVIPLSGAYDDRRSNLKTLESAMAGNPWVATDAPPYQESGGGILVKNRSAEWFNALNELVSSLTLYHKLSQDGTEWSRIFNTGCARKYEEIFNV